MNRSRTLLFTSFNKFTLWYIRMRQSFSELRLVRLFCKRSTQKVTVVITY